MGTGNSKEAGRDAKERAQQMVLREKEAAIRREQELVEQERHREMEYRSAMERQHREETERIRRENAALLLNGLTMQGTLEANTVGEMLRESHATMQQLKKERDDEMRQKDQESKQHLEQREREFQQSREKHDQEKKQLQLRMEVEVSRERDEKARLETRYETQIRQRDVDNQNAVNKLETALKTEQSQRIVDMKTSYEKTEKIKKEAEDAKARCVTEVHNERMTALAVKKDSLHAARNERIRAALAVHQLKNLSQTDVCKAIENVGDNGAKLSTIIRCKVNKKMHQSLTSTASAVIITLAQTSIASCGQFEPEDAPSWTKPLDDFQTVVFEAIHILSRFKGDQAFEDYKISLQRLSDGELLEFEDATTQYEVHLLASKDVGELATKVLRSGKKLVTFINNLKPPPKNECSMIDKLDELQRMPFDEGSAFSQPSATAAAKKLYYSQPPSRCEQECVDDYESSRESLQTY